MAAATPSSGPSQVRSGRVGDDGVSEAAESRRFAVGVDEQLGDLRAQALGDMGDERAAGERQQRLFRAHARRTPAREHDAGDWLKRESDPLLKLA